MRLHTSVIHLLPGNPWADALPAGVTFGNPITRHGSRVRAMSFEVQLSGSSKLGGQYGRTPFKTATWDEWGIFLARLYELDPEMVAYGAYGNAREFDFLTGNRFLNLTDSADQHLRHKWDTYRTFTGEWREVECSCGAVRRTPIRPLAEIVGA